MGLVSTGPELLLFKRFKEQWQFMDVEKFQPTSTDPSVEALVESSRVNIIEFAEEQLKLKQRRDDYREFLELSIIFFGGIPARGIHFQAPRAMHRARWLAKVIYAIKIWLFRGQFRMTLSEERGIRELAVFAVLIYLKAWISAPRAVEAPLNDFLLMKQLLQYQQAVVSTATSKKFSLHLWYLSEDLVGLALFDSRIPPETKKLMLAVMEEDAPEHPPKRPRIASNAFLGDRGIEQFCTANSKSLLHIFGLSDEVLSKDPDECREDMTFQHALAAVTGLAVVNDRAERGVALIQDYNGRWTKGEEQLQFLLQVVSDHRKKFPNCVKEAIISK